MKVKITIEVEGTKVVKVMQQEVSEPEAYSLVEITMDSLEGDLGYKES